MGIIKRKRNSMNKIPIIISILCRSGAYIVGSYANYLIDKKGGFKDYDLIVPPDKWYIVSLLIPKTAKLNSYGGLKFIDSEGNSIDIWPSSIEQYLRQYKSKSKKGRVLDYMNNKIFTVGDLI